MGNPCIHWLGVLQGLTLPVVAVFGAYIGWRQWRTSRDKLKLDLFDRRLAVYDQAIHAWAEFGRTGAVTADQIRELSIAENRAVFLFRPEVSASIYDLRRTLAAVRASTSRTQAARTEEERRAAIDAAHDLALTTNAFHKELTRLVDDQMSFR